MRNISEFKIEIGTHYKDNKRDIVITDKEYRKVYNKDGIFKQNQKWYKYKCNICTWEEGWIDEASLLSGIGCSVCTGKTVVEGINSIVNTDKWLIPYFQGGYDEAKLYSAKSGKKIFPKCPICGMVKRKQMSIKTIYYQKSTGCKCTPKRDYKKFINTIK